MGGAALAGTVVYYFVDRKSEPASQGKTRTPEDSGFNVHLAPLAGYGQAGVAVFGTF